jgi:hypothetical protein
MIGAIGEILGATGVVVSLVYVASGIRASAQAARQAAAQSVLRQANGFVERLSFDSGAAYSIWLRGHQGLSHLKNDEEVARFGGMLLVLMRSAEELFYYHRDGRVDEWAYRSLAAPLLEIATSPGFQEWWQHRGHWFGPEFRADLEQQLARRATGKPYTGRIQTGTDSRDQI